MKHMCEQVGCFFEAEIYRAATKKGYEEWKDLNRIRDFVLNQVCKDCFGVIKHGGPEGFIQYCCQELGVDYLPPTAK